MFTEKHKCPHCTKITFGLTHTLTTAKCDNCGFEIDYEKIPFMQMIVNQVKQIRKAITIPIELDEDDNEL